MSATKRIEDRNAAAVEEPAGADLLRPLMLGQATRPALDSGGGLVIGELVALTETDRTPLVRYPGPGGTTTVAARSVVDLLAAQVGKPVALLFEAADLRKPIIVGVLRDQVSAPLDPPLGQVEVEVDGERMVVSAKEQLVLRCGKASITLTRAGKVLIQGDYVSSRSSGVNRIKGGSVQIN